MNITSKTLILTILLSISGMQAYAAKPHYTPRHNISQNSENQAFRLIQEMAKQGDTRSQLDLGTMYSKGIGTTQDYEQAKYWFEKAAHNDNAEAQFNLGIIYYEGQGTAQDYRQAKFWWEKAAEQGNAEAAFNLGIIHYAGKIGRASCRERVCLYV